MIFFEGVASVTDYTVSLYPESDLSTPTGNSPYPLTEDTAGIYSASPTEADGRYVLRFSRGATLLSGFARYELSGGAEATVGAAQADIGALPAPDNAAIAAAAAAATSAASDSAALNTRLTDARAAQLDGVAQTTDLDNIDLGGTDLTTIAADAALARKAAVNSVEINEVLRTATILDDDNLTPVAVFDLTPTATAAVGRTKRTTT